MQRLYTAMAEITFVPEDPDYVGDASKPAKGAFVATDGHLFDERAQQRFSLFKHGYMPPAVYYAHRLAARIAEQLHLMTIDQPIFVIGAPYKYVPTASQLIAEYLCTELVGRGFNAELLPFHKSQVGDSSYAQGDEDERQAQLDALVLSIDQSRIVNSIVLVVDDIRITGSAELTTAKHLEPLQPHTIWYLHAYRMDEATARKRSYLESVLNEMAPLRLMDFSQQYRDKEFRLCTRVLRFMLEACAEEFWNFLVLAPNGLMVEINNAAIGTGKEYCERYVKNLTLLREELTSRHTRPW